MIKEIKQERLNKEVNSGKIFIYPTDTVYGLGCDAENKKSVKRIKQIKNRDKNKPMSIIAPSKDWIKQNLIVNMDLDKYLPGRYTLLLNKKDENFMNHVSPNDKLGIRMPDHEFCYKIQKTKKPFITTSANKAGEKPPKTIDEISKEVREKVDYIIDKAELNGKPSSLIMAGKRIDR